MTITKATPAHAADIAQLIMTAMTEDCCQFLAGKDHTLDDFYQMMVKLVLMDDSQYSWRNAFVALDDEATNGNLDYAPVAGAIVGYDGKDLRLCADVFRRRLSAVLIWTTPIWMTRHRRASFTSTRLLSTLNIASVALPLSC